MSRQTRGQSVYHRRDRLRAAMLREESLDAVARAARDLIAHETAITRGRIDPARLHTARQRFEDALEAAAEFSTHRQRRSWRADPQQIAGTLP